MDAEKRVVEDYIKKHKVKELIDHLSSMLMFFRPEDPCAFLAEAVQEMKEMRENGEAGPLFYPEDNIKAYFRLLDPSGKGSISWMQMVSALTVLGAECVPTPIPKEGPVNLQMFLKMAEACLSKKLDFM